MAATGNLLKQADIFYNLAPRHLELIAELCEERAFNADEIIFPEGSHSDELYVIVQGDVDILIDTSVVSVPKSMPTEPVTIATLRRGQSFGEIALVDQGLRSATARAAHSPTRLLVIESQRLRALCDAHPELGYRLMENLAADLALKFRNNNLRIREELLYSDKSGSK